MNLPELHTSVLCVKSVNMCESICRRVAPESALSRWACPDHTGSVWKLEREFKGGSLLGSPGIYHPNIPTSITNNQDQPAHQQEPRLFQVVRWPRAHPDPSGSRSLSVVVYLSLGTTLARFCAFSALSGVFAFVAPS